MQNALENPSFGGLSTQIGPSPGARVSPQMADMGLAQRVGFSFVLLFLFVTFARIPEFLAELVGVTLPLALVLSIFAGIAALFAANLRRLSGMHPVVWLIVFSVWLGVAGLFSSWHGGTLEMFRDYWSKSILICLVIAMLVLTLDNVRRVMLTLAYATLVVIILAVVLSRTTMGRFAVGGTGSLSNPNELASRLLMGVCFCLFVVSAERGFSVKRILILCAIPVGLILALRTGSRSGLLTLIVLFLMLIARVSLNKKVLLLGGAAALVAVVMFFLPTDAAERYATMFSTREDIAGTDATDEQKIAVNSSAQRRRLLEEGTGLAMSHPLFGVGPGVYAAAAANVAEAEGRRAMWHETHNTYVQLAAEDGILGLLLYLFAIGGCLAMCWSAYRKTRKYPALSELSGMAFYLMLALISWAVGAFFDSEAYRLEFPMLAALIAAFSLAARPKIEQYVASLRSVPVPAPLTHMPVQAGAPLPGAPKPSNPYKFGRIRTR